MLPSPGACCHWLSSASPARGCGVVWCGVVWARETVHVNNERCCHASGAQPPSTLVLSTSIDPAHGLTQCRTSGGPPYTCSAAKTVYGD